MTKYYKEGYPRPQFVRDSFLPLNGLWNFRFDPFNEGLLNGWQNGFTGQNILVPFSYESKAGGIGKTEACPVIWYSREAEFPHREGSQVLLNFEGADYRTRVWINGIPVREHEGGYTRFTFDITSALKAEKNTVVCRIEDTFSTTQPRGKQRWLKDNYDCWYTQTTGIWKDVWAEEVFPTHIRSVHFTPLYDENSVEVEYELSGFPYFQDKKENLEFETLITYGDFIIYSGKDKVIKDTGSKKISLINEPVLFAVNRSCEEEVTLTLPSEWDVRQAEVTAITSDKTSDMNTFAEECIRPVTSVTEIINRTIELKRNSINKIVPIFP